MKRFFAWLQKLWRTLFTRKPMTENPFYNPVMTDQGVFFRKDRDIPIPSESQVASFPYQKTDGKWYYTDHEGEHEFGADGLGKLIVGLGLTLTPVSTPEGDFLQLSIAQTGITLGKVAVDSLDFFPDKLPASGSTPSNLLFIDESVTGATLPLRKIPFEVFLLKILGRLMYVDVPASPNSPGEVGNYSFKDSMLYMFVSTGPFSRQWVRWNVDMAFANEGGTTIAVPANLQATLSGDKINLTWQYATTANSFEIFVSAGDQQHFEKLPTAADGTARSYAYTPPSSDMQYFFQVRAVTTQGTSQSSNIANATTPPAANRWASVQNLVLTPNSSNSSIQASFTALNAGTIIRFDITKNANAQADPADPASQGWEYHGYIQVTSPGAKTYTFPNISDTSIRKVRVLVYDNNTPNLKQPSVWVMGGPVSLSDSGELAKPTITGALDANSVASISGTIPSALTGVVLFIERRQGTSGDWTAAGQSGTSNYNNIPAGGQAASSSYQYRAYYVTTAGAKSKYSDVITLTAQAQPTLPVLRGAYVDNNYLRIYWENRASFPNKTLLLFYDDRGAGYGQLASYPPTFEGTQLSTYGTPQAGTLKYRARFEGETGYSNEIVAVFSALGVLESLTGNPGETPGGTSDGVTYQLRTVAEYKSGNHNPWDNLFGYFNNPFIPGGIIWDLVGGAHPIGYSLSTLLQKISKMGVAFTGIYSKTSNVEAGLADFKNREAQGNRYVYLNQSSYAETNPPLPASEHDAARQQLWDTNPVGYDQDWTLDDGTKLRVAAGTPLLWNIIWARLHQAGNGSYNSDFDAVRVNCEHHEVESWSQILKIRYLGQGGKYRPERLGGNFAGDGAYTSLTDADFDAGKEPAYKDMSDAQFYEFYSRCQVSYDERWFRTWHQNGKVTIGYQAESSPGFFQDVQNVRGYRRTGLFRTTSFNGKRYKDFLTACCRFGGDVQLSVLPFLLVYMDEMDDWLTSLYHMADDLGVQEDNVTRTGLLTAGAPEYYRYSVSATGLVKIYFEDMAGNTRKTTRPMRIESAFTKDGNGYGNMIVWTEIPVGTSELEIQLTNAFVKESNLSKFVDEELVNVFEFTQLYTLDMISQGLEGYPIQNQVYGYLCAHRGANLNIEVQNGGQMPKQFVHGLRMMGYTYNYMHVMYNMSSVNGMRTADHVFAVQKRMNKYNAHWNNSKKAVQIEVSMDGGNTWTASEVATWRNDLSSDFLVHNPQAYNAVWINNRHANNQASPLVFVSYNTATGSVVICEKTVFGNNLTYSFRFKKPDGTYATYLNRQITNQWKDSWGSATPTPDPDPDPEPQPEPSGSLLASSYSTSN